MKNKLFPLFTIAFLFGFGLNAQQLPDTTYKPPIHDKAYPENNGTIVYIDEAHNNFHTKDNRYRAFAKLLESDGYQIAANYAKFDDLSLRDIEIMVIANARPDNMPQPVVAPIPSAFTKKEIEAVKKWVKEGGSLFLIADHMPFAGAASELAAAFGFKCYDSFVMYHPRSGTIDFSIDNQSLTKNIITTGRSKNESVQKVRSFTGQGFEVPDEAVSILNLDESQTVYLTDTVWVFNEEVKTFSAKNLSQGAILSYEKGKVAMWGEAAMFTAQLSARNGQKFGMSSMEAKENFQLLLNLIHWLDHLY